MKMIEKDTIKGLECCTDKWYENCNECPYSIDTVSCERMKLLEDSLDLINHKQELLDAAIAGQETLQKALAKKEREIDDLKIENQSLRTAANRYKFHYNEVRAEAIGEFSSGVKEILGSLFFAYYPDGGEAIDHLANKIKDSNGMNELKSCPFCGRKPSDNK